MIFNLYLIKISFNERRKKWQLHLGYQGEGQKKGLFFRIVAADVRAPRDGRYLERLGTYNPMKEKNDPERVTLDKERIKYWLSVGAKPTERVQKFLANEKLAEKPVISKQTKKDKPRKKTLEKLKTKEEKLKAKQEALASSSEQPTAEKPTEAAAPQQPAAEKPTEAAAPQQPATEKPTEVAAPQQPAAEKPTEAATPQQPTTEKPTEVATPQQPAAEKPAEANSPTTCC